MLAHSSSSSKYVYKQQQRQRDTEQSRAKPNDTAAATLMFDQTIQVSTPRRTKPENNYHTLAFVSSNFHLRFFFIAKREISSTIPARNLHTLAQTNKQNKASSVLAHCNEQTCARKYRNIFRKKNQCRFNYARFPTIVFVCVCVCVDECEKIKSRQKIRLRNRVNLNKLIQRHDWIIRPKLTDTNLLPTQDFFSVSCERCLCFCLLFSCVDKISKLT